ncbi:M23 family metallopeptidase [Desulfovibrio sp.]|uniref:M23 family metallopeptidase n=1 Tax=Desulfovibrio sp. TaxID=885 RepID=UPI0023BDC456|nr:M23 family metallopeptidase [Desulfovibrio sp.]MDE7240380.1 M23 family metallopeptidase [Desulfovibrio sp.]
MNTVQQELPRHGSGLAVPGFILGLALLLSGTAAAAPAGEGLRLTAPESVARGDAFVARLTSDAPVEAASFFWRGKRHVVSARELADSGQGRAWQAEILLPAPLEEKAASLGLSACVGKKCPKPETSREVRLFDRKRPVQRLTVDRKYVAPPPEQAARIKRDRQKVAAALAQPLPEQLWELPLDRPVPGSVSSLFGLKRVFNGEPRGMHRGLDLRGAEGSPIRACADGVVALVDNLYFSGNAVYINHGNGVFSSYLHMSKPLVTPGERVQRGQVIGLVGATGRVTGPHLHLGMVVQGESVDPQPLLAPAEHGKRDAAPAGGEKK